MILWNVEELEIQDYFATPQKWAENIWHRVGVSKICFFDFISSGCAGLKFITHKHSIYPSLKSAACGNFSTIKAMNNWTTHRVMCFQSSIDLQAKESHIPKLQILH